MEKSRSWPSAHDWKSCIPQKGIEGSNPSFSAKKEVTFVYQKLLLFLSKLQAWYIITVRSAVYIISPYGAVQLLFNTQIINEETFKSHRNLCG